MATLREEAPRASTWRPWGMAAWLVLGGLMSMAAIAQDTGAAGEDAASDRPKYYGYIYLGDVLENKDEVETLREHANFLGMVSKETSLRCRYPKCEAEERDTVIETYLREEGERIRYLDSLDYAIGWPVPLADYFEQQDLEGFKRELRVIEKHLPEMALVDMVYLFDEPNFRDVPAEVIEDFVAAFKEVFPKPKTWFVYAIVHPKFLNTKPPKNADLLGIDPYMFSRHYTNTAADLEYFYRESLACALNWIRRQNRPFLLAGDCFASRDPAGKQMPRAETALWYHQLALTEPNCQGLVWFYYGNVPIESESLRGFNFKDSPKDLQQIHREIGRSLLGPPTPLGLQWETFGPAPE